MEDASRQNHPTPASPGLHPAGSHPVRSIDSAWYGFLVMCFMVVGLAGLFGTYAAQIPFQRAEAAQQLLDRLAALPDPADWRVLQGQMGDNAAILNQASLAPAARIAQARAATRTRAMAEAADLGRRARVVIGIITLGGALFGCILLGAAANQRRQA